MSGRDSSDPVGHQVHVVPEHERELRVRAQRGGKLRQRARQQDVVVVERLHEPGARADQRQVARRRDPEVARRLHVHALVGAHVLRQPGLDVGRFAVDLHDPFPRDSLLGAHESHVSRRTAAGGRR